MVEVKGDNKEEEEALLEVEEIVLDTRKTLTKKAIQERSIKTKEGSTIQEGALGVEDHPLEEFPKEEDLLGVTTATKKGTWPIGVQRRILSQWEKGEAIWFRNLIVKVWQGQTLIKVSMLLITMAILKEEMLY